MQASYSRIDTFKKCPYLFKLRYVDGFQALPADNADNALCLGSAMHICLQESIEKGVESYYSNYSIIDDNVISEAIKLEMIAKKAVELVPRNGRAEVEINTPDFRGFIDWITDEGDIYDFKYCSNEERYKDSAQLHLYKYFYNGNVRNMYFVIIPKVGIRLRKGETLENFRLRIKNECANVEPYLIKVDYDPMKVIKFLTDTKHCIECTEFDKNETNLCHWCEFEKYCKHGDLTYMQLPKNERRSVTVTNRKLWIYGAPFSGKTRFANTFPDPLMLNTDGNIKFVDAPYIAIKDVVNVEGRITRRTYAWKVFKDAITELEKKQNDFKTIVVDLLEDTYEQCRLYMYEQLGITHESDDSFRAWDKIRTEFLSTIKRLMALDYENIVLISHEDSSRDLTKKTGDKITAIKPNLQDKMANKVAGMVDIVARVVADDNVAMLTFKSNETIFGGGRIKVTSKEIPLDFEHFAKLYDLHTAPAKTEEPEPVEQVEEVKAEPVEENAPRARRRRTITTNEE